MEQKERTVIEHLQDIEDKIPDFSSKPQTLSEKVGKPFEEFLNEATIYGYEEDARKFRKDIKDEMRNPLIISFLLLCALVMFIVFYVINKDNVWLLIISTLLVLLNVAFYIVVLLKQKPLQPMKSFWNFSRTDFYIAQIEGHGYLKEEKKRTALSYIRNIYSIAAFGSEFGLLVAYFITNIDRTSEITFWIASLVGFLVVLLNINSLTSIYSFSNYRMDTEDGYLTIPDYEYHKKEKK